MFRFLRRLFSRGRRLIGRFNSFANRSPLIMRNATTLEDLTDDERLYIQITRQSYETNRLNNIRDYTLVFQNVSTVAYKNDTNLIISFRGTASLEDVRTDLALIKHQEQENTRFLNDLALYDKIVKDNPGRNVILTAHSLGGSISLFINSMRDNVDEVYIINPGVNLRNVLQSYGDNSGNVTILRSANDPVSLLAVLSGYRVKTIQTPPGSGLIDSHRLDSFTP